MPKRAAVREQLLIGRHHADRRSREGLEKSIAAYQSALALDPDSAEAYSGLAFSYALLGIYDFWRPREAFIPAETMARRALQLAPDSARAQLAGSVVAAVSRWDWAAALAGSRRAWSWPRTDAEAWYWRGALLSALARHDEAIAAMRRALELEPTSPVINTAFAWYLFRARRDAEAVAQAHRTIELFPDYYDAWDNLKWIQLTLGNEAEALEAWVRSEELDIGDGEGVRRAYEAGGLTGLHRESIKGQIARWEAGHYQSPYDVALEHAALGEVDEALVWLERSFAERETRTWGRPPTPGGRSAARRACAARRGAGAPKRALRGALVLGARAPARGAAGACNRSTGVGVDVGLVPSFAPRCGRLAGIATAGFADGGAGAAAAAGPARLPLESRRNGPNTTHPDRQAGSRRP